MPGECYSESSSRARQSCNGDCTTGDRGHRTTSRKFPKERMLLQRQARKERKARLRLLDLRGLADGIFSS